MKFHAVLSKFTHMIHHKPGIQIKYIPCSTGQPMLFNNMNMKLENNRALKYISTEQFQTVKHGDHFLYMAKWSPLLTRSENLLKPIICMSRTRHHDTGVVKISSLVQPHVSYYYITVLRSLY